MGWRGSRYLKSPKMRSAIASFRKVLQGLPTKSMLRESFHIVRCMKVATLSACLRGAKDHSVPKARFVARGAG